MTDRDLIATARRKLAEAKKHMTCLGLSSESCQRQERLIELAADGLLLRERFGRLLSGRNVDLT